MDFAKFGRAVGQKLIRRDLRLALDYLLTPVNSVRYFEFEFARECLDTSPGRSLDVGSPRLFSLYVAAKMPSADVLVVNPDSRDLAETRMVASAVGLANLRCAVGRAESLSVPLGGLDTIWSISVVEHIAGEDGDVNAVQEMFAALRPGGRLILTVPVDRTYRIEHRDVDYYGTQPLDETGRFFFQRVYDERAITERLLDPVGVTPRRVAWFGEIRPGSFDRHMAHWQRSGHACTVDDLREIADNYCEYRGWASMPGIGVCGLLIEKEGAAR